MAKASAQELQTMSINLNLAPVLNIDEANGVTMTSRTFGDDPVNVSRCASAITDAHKTLSMGCIVKHFPAPRQGGILDLRVVMNEPRYAPFRRAFESGVDGVFLEPAMWATALTPSEQDFQGRDSLPQNLIRRHFGYEGMLMGSCDRASEKVSGINGGELCIRGFLNGCDMLIVCEHPSDMLDTLEEIYTAVDMKKITRAQIEQSLERIRRVKDREALEAAASVILGDIHPSGVLPFKRYTPPVTAQGPQPARTQRWEVHPWEKRRDLYASADLWKKCLGWKWRLDASTLSNLLDRPGQSRHFVVKDPLSHGKILGLCATYMIRAGKSLVGSIAILIVDPEFRNRGIGLALHDEALQSMRVNPEISSVHLGSIFPRFFPGLPVEMPASDQEWFARRGWRLEDSFIYDLYMNIDNWHQPDDVFGPLSDQGITFGACSSMVFDDLIQFEDKHFAAYPGWVEKYRALKETDGMSH
ncbi:Beta-hexosaminidase [Dactylella cylindrospora]|nr:Beta-hexosaminidase [Dactylella cylindrospora]